MTSVVSILNPQCEIKRIVFEKSTSNSKRMAIALIISQPQIESFDFGFSPDLNDSEMESIANHCQNITFMNFEYCPTISVDCLKRVLCCWKNLLDINLNGCSWMTDEHANVIAEHCPNIVTFTINMCKFSDPAIVNLLKNCKKITYFSMVGCGLTDMTICALSCFTKSLTHLYIANNPKITNQSIAMMCKKCKDLEFIDITASLSMS